MKWNLCYLFCLFFFLLFVWFLFFFLCPFMRMSGTCFYMHRTTDCVFFAVLSSESNFIKIATMLNHFRWEIFSTINYHGNKWASVWPCNANPNCSYHYCPDISYLQVITDQRHFKPNIFIGSSAETHTHWELASLYDCEIHLRSEIFTQPGRFASYWVRANTWWTSITHLRAMHCAM